MVKFIEPFLLTFIPIFVAVDSLGNVPLFISLVDGFNKKQKHRVIIESITTATVMALAFIFVGQLVLTLLGITISDFQIAGGLLLFVLSVYLLLPGTSKGLLSDGHHKDVGVFPLGTPLITGPAVLTTTLMMVNTFGIMPTFVSLVLNMLIVWFTLVKADVIIKIMGTGGARALSKITYIVLAAIGVMMVRHGLEVFFR
ncbi:MAG: MarC family protein [Candidatus Omnitrophota bacterium]